jgi:hypothetical protein
MTQQAKLERIAREEAGRFLDDNFAPLDLSGCVSFLKPPSEESQLPDDRFAPLQDSGLGASALKRGIEQLATDPEVQLRIAQETGNPELLEDYQNSRAEMATREFLRRNPSYFRCPENWERIAQTLAFNALGWAEDEADAEEAEDELIQRGLWTVENLTAAFKALSRSGSLQVRRDQPRNLSEHERRAIALQAGSGDVDGAISRYLLLRAPQETAEAFMDAPTASDALEEIANPALAKIVDEAVWFCFEQGRPGYSPTPARRRFMRTYVAGRIPTARLLDEAWAACQDDERDAMRASVLGPMSNDDPSSAPDLDNLSDDDVDRLYHGTLRKIAADSRRGSVN